MELFANLPVASSGPGTAVDVSAMGKTKTIVVGGSFAGSLNVEYSLDAAAEVWAQIATFYGSGTQTVEIAAHWMRTLSNNAGGANVDVGSSDAGSAFVQLPSPPVGGVGAQADISGLPLFKTVVVGPFDGTINIEVSEDGISWAQVMTFHRQGGHNLSFYALFARVRSTVGSPAEIWIGGANHSDAEDTITADYVIVGLGTAGAVLARFLTEDMQTSVIVIEAGSNFTTSGAPADRALVAQGAPFGNETVANDPKFSSYQVMGAGEASPGLVPYTGGRMWGGGSSHNDMMTVRSTPDVYDDWATACGNAQWNYNNLLPYMLFMEQYIPDGTVANPAQRGSAGALAIFQDPPFAGDPGLAAIAAATAVAANAPQTADYNDPTLGDVSTTPFQWFSTPPPNGRRSSSSQAYLPISVVTPNGQGVGGRKLTVVSNATTLSLILDTNGPLQASGVKYFLNNNRDATLSAVATKKVIVCAGSLNTPALLQRSGIGDPALLAQYGIPVMLANANVGANTTNHYAPVSVIPIGANPAPIFQGVYGNIDLSGTVAHPTGQAIADGVRRYQILGFPGQAFFPSPAVLSALGEENTPSFSWIGLNVIPKATGTVEITSLDPLTPPRFSIGCYEDVAAPTDLDRAVDFFRVIANISLAYNPGVMPIWPPAAHFPTTDVTPYPGAAAPDDSLLREDAKQMNIHAFHITGSCRMGTSAANGVVDANLNVFGVAKLAICDNSVIPRITTGNTSYPAYVLGLKKAQIEGALIP